MSQLSPIDKNLKNKEIIHNAKPDILDPFVGSGATGIACALLERNFTGIELYPENRDIANKCIESAIKGKFRLKTQYQTERSRKDYSTTLETFLSDVVTS